MTNNNTFDIIALIALASVGLLTATYVQKVNAPIHAYNPKDIAPEKLKESSMENATVGYGNETQNLQGNENVSGCCRKNMTLF